MPLSKDDRIAFSLQIVGSTDQIKGLDMAKAQLQVEIEKAIKLDTANKNLFDPVNTLVNAYQLEYQRLDGQLRTTFNEQNIQDAANKKMQNYFFPNDMNVTVPSLASTQNIWTKIKPFAISYAIGKNYSEAYGVTTKEPDLISACTALITSASTYTNMNNTTGQRCTTATPPATGDTIAAYPEVQQLKTDLVNAVNALRTFLIAEAASVVTNDPANQANNDAAIANINTVIIPALNTWLAYNDFNTAHGQTTCAGFNGYNSNLLAPTKLHSVQLAALQSALIARSSYIVTRLSQLSSVMGTIVQDINTGELTSSTGLYGRRYGFLLLRLNILGGSLMSLVGMQAAASAQDGIKANIISTKNTYLTIIPTSILAAPASGTNIVNLVDASQFAVGDTVWVMAEGQEELQRAVKAVNGNMVTLNDIIPSKYRPAEKARLYKDLT